MVQSLVRGVEQVLECPVRPGRNGSTKCPSGLVRVAIICNDDVLRNILNNKINIYYNQFNLLKETHTYNTYIYIY